MPELPEVETVRKVLKKDLVGLKIKKVDVFYKEMIKTDIGEFKNNLIDEEYIDIKRYGKWLVFETTNYNLVSHLRMEGKYYYSNEFKKDLHEHVVFSLSNGYFLRYKDVRKFGVMYLVSKDKLFTDTPLANLGLEPFNKDLNVSYLKNKFKNKRIPIKTLLLDQEIIAGLGNIYANEVLFKSEINPHKKGNLITDSECLKIIKNSKDILQNAIDLGGTTIRSYTSSLGVEGSYQTKLLVHMQDKCKVCGNKIIREKINGRSTYYCKTCQGDVYE